MNFTLMFFIGLIASAEPSTRNDSEPNSFPWRWVSGSSEVSSDIESIWREAYATLPQALRPSPGETYELEWHSTPSSFGMGDGSLQRPIWSHNGRRFHVYQYRDSNEERVLIREKRLSFEQRQTLWRKRALVHLLMHQLEQKKKFSQNKEWIQLSGWSRPFPLLNEKAKNAYLHAFSRKLGKESAALDLITFAEEALVPVEQIDPNAVSVDNRVQCQEFSKSRFLRRLLQEAVGSNDPLPRGPCPSFDAWARVSALSHFEILFAEPSGVRSQSLFGHAMLRAVHDLGEAEGDSSRELSFEVAALTGSAEDPFTFLFRGFGGSYLTTLSGTPLASLLKSNLEVDQRNLRRFRLNLTPEENARVAERIWEMQRRGYWPYYFFTDNCASLLLWVLLPALEDAHQPAVPWGAFVAPVQVIGALEKVQLPDGRPLAERLPELFKSNHEEAIRSEEWANETLLQLRQQAPEWEMEWRLFLQSIQGDTFKRRAAYASLPGLMEKSVLSRPDLRPQFWALLNSVLSVEMYAANVAQKGLAALDEKRIAPEALKAESDAVLVARRQQRYLEERPGLTFEADLDEFISQRKLRDQAPRRAATASEVAQEKSLREVLETYFFLTSQAGKITSTYFSEVKSRSTIPVSAAVDRLPGHGFWRLSAGPAALVTEKNTGAAGAFVQLSGFGEPLGDQRTLNAGTLTEVRLVDSRAWLTWGREGFVPPRVEVDLARFRTLVREPEALRTFFGHFGYGFGAHYQFRPLSGLPHVVSLHGEGYWPMWLREKTSQIALLGLGAQVQATPSSPHSLFTAGPRLEALLRLPTYGGAGARLEASWLPSWGLQNGRFQQQADVSVGVETPLRFNATRLGLITTRLDASAWAFDNRLETSARLSIALEAL